jgi:hypothetical protein
MVRARTLLSRVDPIYLLGRDERGEKAAVRPAHRPFDECQ